MKTPREILMARHRAAGPKLDAIRESVIRDLHRQNASQPNLAEALAALLLCLPNTLWRELILPSRRIWTGLTAVWLVLLVINLSQRDTVSSVTGKPVHSPAVMMSWQVQQRWMNELMADRSTPPPDADRPRNAAPRPRTENHAIATV